MWSADQIRALRTRLGLEQTEFARLVGVDVRSVVRWEGGVAKPTGASEAVLSAIREKLERTEDEDSADSLVSFLVGAVAVGGLAYLLVKLLDKATVKKPKKGGEKDE